MFSQNPSPHVTGADNHHSSNDHTIESLQTKELELAAGTVKVSKYQDV